MLRRLSVSLGITLLIAVTGCSGAESSDLFGPEAAGGAGAGDQQATDTPAASTDSTTPSTGDDGAPTQQDPPAPTPRDPGTGPGTDPDPQKPTCAAEGLSNDSFQNADKFDSCIAGKLIGKDIDFVTITAPMNVSKIFIDHSESGGNVAYKVFVNGFSATFTDTPPADLMAFPGAKYTFKVEPSGSLGDRSWELKVTFQ